MSEIFMIETKPCPSEAKKIQAVLMGGGAAFFFFSLLIPVVLELKLPLVQYGGMALGGIEMVLGLFWPRFMLAKDKSGRSFHFSSDELVIKRGERDIQHVNYDNIVTVTEDENLSPVDRDAGLNTVILHLDKKMPVYGTQHISDKLLLKGVAETNAFARIKEVVEKNKRA